MTKQSKAYDQSVIEQALVESEKSLRFMADTMPQLVWISRPDGFHEYYNKQWLEFTGTTPDDVPRDTKTDKWKKLYHPNDYQRAWETWLHSLETGESYEIEYRLYHAPSDRYRWVISRALPYKDAAGVVQRWYGTSTDIDEQKHAVQLQTFLSNASKELSSSLDYEAMLMKITELCVPVAADWCSVDLYDSQKGFEQVSVAHVDPKKVSVAKKYREHNPVQVDNPTGVPAVVRTGKTEFYHRITDEMLEAHIKDAKTLKFMKSLNLCSIIIAPLSVDGKTIGGISFVSSDSGRYYDEADLHMAEELAARISLAMTNSKLYADSKADVENRKHLARDLRLEKQKLESRVIERTEQLQLTNEGLRDEIKKRRTLESQRIRHFIELNRSKDEFISIASHQLRTPATGVKQYVGMLLEGFMGELDPQQRQILEKAYQSNERQLKIVSDLLKVAQVDAGKIMLRKSQVLVNELVEDVIREQQSVFAARHQTISHSLLNPDIAITIDRASMRMVLENVIDNASKYSESDTQVEVAVEERGNDLYISIRDQGVGINPTIKSRLFEKFSRLDNPLSMKVGGTGLGLYWAKKIVSLHGGALTYAPNKSRGSIFTIRVPKT